MSNNSKDLFSKMLGTTPASTNQSQAQSGESTSTTEPASTQSDKGANNVVSSSKDQKQTFGSSVSHNVFNPSVPSTSPVGKKKALKSVDVKKVLEKINVKLVAGIAIALVVVIFI